MIEKEWLSDKLLAIVIGIFAVLFMIMLQIIIAEHYLAQIRDAVVEIRDTERVYESPTANSR